MISPPSVTNSTVSPEQFEEQQKQIDLLATSLENVMGYLQRQNNEVNGSPANPANTTGQVGEYLAALIHNSGVLKTGVDAIGPVIVALQRSMEKRDADRAKELQSLQKSQEDLCKAMVGIRKVIQQQSAPRQLAWKPWAIAALGVALVSAIASGASVYFVTAAMQSNGSSALTEKSSKNRDPASQTLPERQGSKSTPGKSARVQSSR
jgi:hypothetical protein